MTSEALTAAAKRTSTPHADPPITDPPVRQIGRPRASGVQVHDRSTRDEIIAVATRLFAERGFAKITMSDIARAAGLQQPSLYYWFKRKELILQAIFAVDRSPLEFVEQIAAGSGSPALKLYRLVKFDTYQLCYAPCDVTEIARLAGQQPQLFSDFWEYRQRLHRWFAILIRTGVAEGQFIDVDPELAAWNAMAADAGVQGWFQYQNRQPSDSVSVYTAEEIASSVADATLRALLRRGTDLRAVKRDASQIDDQSAIGEG